MKKNASTNEYYDICYNIALNDGKSDRKDELLEELEKEYDEYKDEREELKTLLKEASDNLKEISKSIAEQITEISKFIEKRREEYVKNTDNLLLIHPRSWNTTDKIEAHSVSLKFPTAIVFILIGIMSVASAILIPDTIIEAFTDGQIDDSTKWIIKICIFLCFGGVLYLIISKTVASKRYNKSSENDGFQYSLTIYLAAIGGILFIALMLYAFGEENVSRNLLLFFGLNSFILLPVGLATISYHIGLIRTVKKMRNRLNNSYKEFSKVQDRLLELQNGSLSSSNLLEKYEELGFNREAIRLGYEKGISEKMRVDARKAEINKKRKSLGLS